MRVVLPVLLLLLLACGEPNACERLCSEQAQCEGIAADERDRWEAECLEEHAEMLAEPAYRASELDTCEDRRREGCE